MTRSDPTFRTRNFGLLCGIFVAACAPTSAPTSELVPSGHTHFTVRGRLDAPVVHYAIDPTGSPIAAQRLREACVAASSVWNQATVASVNLSQSETPNLVISFQRDVHGSCTPFGRSTVLAHTGPCGPDNYLHLDAERDWTSDPKLLERVLAHEFGHALGLGHSLDPVALMHAEDHAERSAPQASDLAGLHSLYGGGTDSETDLAIVSGECKEQGERTTVLRGVSLGGNPGVECFDTQGDGPLELLVWDTSDAGQGGLTIYSFNEDLNLASTFGPLYGICPPLTMIELGVTKEGERLLVRIQADGSAHALRFTEQGKLEQRSQANFDLGQLTDLDGDGMLDNSFTFSSPRAPCLFEADINQDGQLESVRRLSGPRNQ